MRLLNKRLDLIFLSAGFLLTIFCILFFKPVADAGDGPVYLRYAQTIIENGDTGAFIHRAPLYPWFLAFFIYTLGETVAIKIIFVLQYFLLFISAALLYNILIGLFNRKLLAVSAALLALVNLSGIYYGYMLLTETTTLFLLIVTIWFLINALNKSSSFSFIIGGITVSAMVLVRFNTFPLLLFFSAIILLWEHIAKKIDLRTTFRNLALFVIPVIIILNGYSFMNYKRHDFYGLFPSGGSLQVSRNALIATLDGTEKVSRENLVILNIFMAASGYSEEKKPVERKGSLTRFDRFRLTEKLYRGFPVYTAALPELCSFFSINPDKPEPDLSRKLVPFYNEVRKLNSDKIWSMRALSLLNSFRSSTGLVIPQEPDLNLGRLPAWMIIGYKLIIITISVIVFPASIIYLILSVLKLIKVNLAVVMFILVISGFFLINFMFAAESNANRFKYPAEPLIISLSVYYIYGAFLYLKRKMTGY